MEPKTKKYLWIGGGFLLVAGLVTTLTLVFWDFGDNNYYTTTTTTMRTTTTFRPRPTQERDIRWRTYVVDYNRTIIPDDPLAEAMANCNEYIKVTWRGNTIDFIIFPEGGLNSIESALEIPDVYKGTRSCRFGQYHEIINKLCLEAYGRGMYLIVNLVENSTCPDSQQIRLKDPRPCPPSGINYYNTNVVFNGAGEIIAKYRKFNVINEPGILNPYKPESVSFLTKFNEKFGLITGSDILFEQPASDLRKSGINNFIMPSRWFSELPFLTALQVYQGWAYTHNVNLMVSGLAEPNVGSSGTGIYHGNKKRLGSDIQDTQETILLYADVPRIEYGGLVYDIPPTERRPYEKLGLKILQDQVENFESQPIQRGEFSLCHNDFCCSFVIRIYENDISEDAKFYEYRAFAFNGSRTFANQVTRAIRVCGVAACTSQESNSCGKRFDEGEVVENRYRLRIDISGDFNDEQMLVLPSTLDTALHPLAYNNFRVFRRSSREFVLEQSNALDNLLAFGIYGIDYRTKIKVGEEM